MEWVSVFAAMGTLTTPLHMSPVNGLARLAGHIFSCVHMKKFLPYYGDESVHENINSIFFFEVNRKILISLLNWNQ